MLYHHVQRLSLSFHDTRGSHDSIYRIQYDAMSLQYVAVESVISLITAVTTLGAEALVGQGRPAPGQRRIVMLDGREVVEGEVIVRFRAEADRRGRERAQGDQGHALDPVLG